MADQETKLPASITNIYYDCLERIFDFLDLESLLNVANTCKRLQIAAAAKFGDEHGKKTITIWCDPFGDPDKFEVRPDEIVVAGRKFPLPFLRCFGSKISHLYFNPDYPILKYKTVVGAYINQYCADTLTGLTYHDFPFQKPFKNVEKLAIADNNPDDLPNINNWCPNVRHLEICYVTSSPEYIGVNFPHFEHLENLNIMMCTSMMECNVGFLTANPQIQSLDIDILGSIIREASLAMILNLIRTHQSISKFKVTLGAIAQVTAAESLQLASEHPSMVELNLKKFQFTVDDAVTIIQQLKSLKKFEFCVQGEAEFNRIRDQLNGDWKCEYRHKQQLDVGIIVPEIHNIVLTRKN